MTDKLSLRKKTLFIVKLTGLQHQTGYESEGSGDERSEIHQRLGDEREENSQHCGESQDAGAGEGRSVETTEKCGGGADQTASDK